MGYKLKRIMIHDNGVEKQVRPKWKPGANTIAYYPLDGDALDYSINQTKYNGTWNGTESYVTLQSGLKVANFPYDGTTLRYITSSCTTAPKTVSFWLKFNDLSDTTSGQDWKQIIGQVNSESGLWQLRMSHSTSSLSGQWQWSSGVNASLDLNWHYMCLLLDGTTVTLYQDNVQVVQWTNTTTASNGNLYIGGQAYGYNGSYKRALHGYMSNVILESVLWTAQEITNYYNRSKSNYGL